MALSKISSHGVSGSAVSHTLDIPYQDNITAGRLIVVGIACYANGDSTPRDFTATDSQGNTFYIAVGSIGTGAASFAGIAWSITDVSVTGLTDYVRVGYSGSQNYEKWFTAGYAAYQDISSIPSEPVDKTNSSDTTAATWSVSTGSDIAQGNEVIAGVVTHDGFDQQDPYTIAMTLTGSWTEGTDNIYEENDTRVQSIHFHAKVVTSIGTYTSTGDLGQNSDGGNPYRRVAVITTFKGATEASPTNIVRVSKRIRW